MKKQKTFILDTSVLLYDCHSIHSLAGHKVIIPIVVLDELDRFKDRQALIGENARYINRYLDGLRAKGNINKGVEIENGQTIRVELNCYDDKFQMVLRQITVIIKFLVLQNIFKKMKTRM